MAKKILSLLLFVGAVALFSITVLGSDSPKISPEDAAALVREGKAILIDVREPAEWTSTGVAAPALLLAKSDFDGTQAAWKPFLATVDKETTVVLYCRSGNRSGKLAAILAQQGFKVANAGGLTDWQKAGLPIRKIE
ncbi:MAG: rhodanese-like domain-containing protein [Candidatus Didemnitutus sp.]|nr:rhodanese-like domain-containing protein [Candidatus Didemnitutus sp.]